ncbi:unnamed protein product [Caenorhabditis nigoni]
MAYNDGDMKKLLDAIVSEGAGVEAEKLEESDSGESTDSEEKEDEEDFKNLVATNGQPSTSDPAAFDLNAFLTTAQNLFPNSPTAEEQPTTSNEYLQHLLVPKEAPEADDRTC